MRTEDFEVLVIGGGTAGIAAAIMASRMGCQTLLVERQGYLGGMATAALVHSLCGLYRIRTEPGVEYANHGFPREFAEALQRSGASPGPVRMGRLDVLPHIPSGLARVADQLCQAEAALTVWFHTEVFALNATGAASWEADLICRGTPVRIRAQAVIDTSGDGSAAALAGLPVETVPSHRFQRPAYIAGFQGWPEFFFSEAGRLQLAHAMVRAIRDGVLVRGATGAQFRGSGRPGEAFCTIDLSGGADYDPHDMACLTRLEMEGRAIAEDLVRCLRASVPGLESIYLSQIPSRAGIRESRRVVTRQMLTGDELLAGTRFPDRIAAAAWPMESRETATGPKWRFPEGDEPGWIPLGALRPVGWDHFFVAGRCLGATHEAQASIRVMGTCLATGAAAGVSAAGQLTDGEVSAASVLASLA